MNNLIVDNIEERTDGLVGYIVPTDKWKKAFKFTHCETERPIMDDMPSDYKSWVDCQSVLRDMSDLNAGFKYPYTASYRLDLAEEITRCKRELVEAGWFKRPNMSYNMYHVYRGN